MQKLKLRNRPLAVALIILVGIIIGVVLWMDKNRATPVSSISESRLLMDTEVTLTLYGEELDQAKEAAFDTMAHLEKLSDPYRDYKEVTETNLYRLNEDTATTPISLPEDLYQQIKVGTHYFTLSQGEYTIGIFRLTDLWKKSEEENKLPIEAEIQEIIKESNLSTIEFNDDNHTIMRSPQIKFDLGSIAKGYSVQKAYDTLKEYTNVRGAVINGGGNIMVLGTKDNSHPGYTIGLQDPETPENILGTIPLTSGEVISTSGDYQRYYTIEGKHYSHILSGTTGFPPTYFKSVTVLTTDGTASDIVSTILYLLPYEEGKEFLSTLDIPAEALWIDTQNVIRKTEGFPITFTHIEDYTYEE